MSDAGTPFCRDVSLEAGESLAGTAAARVEHWLVIECKAAWGPKGVEDSQLPAALLERLLALTSAEPRLRVQLIRQPELKREATRVFLGSAGERGGGRLCALELPSLEAVAELDVATFLAGRTPEGAREEREPLYLVCTHGRRDRCCAQRGLPVYAALHALAPRRVMQTTHLGGHRFAATLIVLPHGICYGRVEPDHAAALLRAHDAGRFFDLAHVRGRSAYGPEAQVAEVSLREALGELDLGSLELLAEEACPPEEARPAEHIIAFRQRATGAVHRLRVERQPLRAIPASCGAEPKAVTQLVALRAPCQQALSEPYEA